MFAPVPVPSEGPRTPADLPAGASTYAPLVTVVARPKEPPRDEDADILAEAHERFQTCVTAESERDWKKNALEELNFVDGLQHWSEEMKADRADRPCLVFDRIGPSVDQVVNNARQNPPEPRFSPVGDGADKKTAEILQGLLRNIEQDSAGEVAYMTGYEHAVKIGRGWWRVLFEYETPDSFELKIVLRRVPNPFSIYRDPAAEEFDYSDMRYAFVTEDLDAKTYRDLYPDSKVAGLSNFEDLGDRVKEDWFPKGAVRVAEYWKVVTEHFILAFVQLPDGRRASMPKEKVPPGGPIIAQRKSERRKVFCYKINGAEVIEKVEWPGQWIPLIPCLGREVIRDGKRTLRGMIRPAMDANLSYDYMRSKQVEAIALAPLAPWVAEEGQLEGYEHQWNESNRKAHSVLKYKARDINGTPLAPPQRNVQEPAIQAITIAVQHADNDVKATLSTYDASLGSPGPEFSGKAILARQRQGDNAHFNYHDNLARSMAHTGRVILDLIPHIYSEERAVTIFDPDGNARLVDINKPFIEQGIQQIYRLGPGIGRYNVTVGSGPSYASRRQQGADALMELTRTMPDAMVRALDLVVKSLDIPNADKVGDRLRPPDIRDEQEGAPPIPPEVQAQMAQQQQMIQVMTEQLNKLNDVIEQKQLDNASKEWIAAMNAQVKLAIENLKTGSAEAMALMQQQFAAIKGELDAMRAEQAPQGPGGPGGPQGPGADGQGPGMEPAVSGAPPGAPEAPEMPGVAPGGAEFPPNPGQ